MSESKKSLAILGLGPVGQTFSRELGESGARLTLWTRDHERAKRLASAGQEVAASPVDAILGADIALLCVADDALEDLARQLALTAPREKAIALHTNGYLGCEVLAPLADNGWSTGKLHPLAPFPPLQPGEDGAASLRGAWCVIDGEAGPGRALETARDLAGQMGAQVLELAADAPAGRYHAAATLLAGGLAALSAAVEELASDSFPEAGPRREAYAHLAARTLANIRDVGPEAALTGPVARGAVGLVGGHLDALADREGGTASAEPLGRAAYRLLGRKMLELALARGSIDRSTAEAIGALLR